MTGISEWVLAGNPLWIWLVGLMWLANVVFLVFACRSYLAARAASRSIHAVPSDLWSSVSPPVTLPASNAAEHTLAEPLLREPVPVPLMVDRFNGDSLLVPSDALAPAQTEPTDVAGPLTNSAVGNAAPTDLAATTPPESVAFGSPVAEFSPVSDDVQSRGYPALSPEHRTSTGHVSASQAGSSSSSDSDIASSRESRSGLLAHAEPAGTASAEQAAQQRDFAERASATQQSADAAVVREPQGPDILLAALRRIQEQPQSARPFRELIRALYLDQSVFTFDCLVDLDPGDRQLALALFKAWLAGTYDADRWEDAFRDSQLDSLGKEMFAAVPGDKAM